MHNTMDNTTDTTDNTNTIDTVNTIDREKYRHQLEILELEHTENLSRQAVQRAHRRLRELYSPESIITGPLEEEITPEERQQTLDQLDDAHQTLMGLFQETETESDPFALDTDLPEEPGSLDEIGTEIEDDTEAETEMTPPAPPTMVHEKQAYGDESFPINIPEDPDSEGSDMMDGPGILGEMRDLFQEEGFTDPIAPLDIPEENEIGSVVDTTVDAPAPGPSADESGTKKDTATGIDTAADTADDNDKIPAFTGEAFRKRREELEQSIHKMVDLTGLKSKVLVNIEKERFHKLSEPDYLRLQIQIYARALNLPPEEASEDFLRLRRQRLAEDQ